MANPIEEGFSCPVPSSYKQQQQDTSSTRTNHWKDKLLQKPTTTRRDYYKNQPLQEPPSTTTNHYRTRLPQEPNTTKQRPRATQGIGPPHTQISSRHIQRCLPRWPLEQASTAMNVWTEKMADSYLRPTKKERCSAGDAVIKSVDYASQFSIPLRIEIRWKKCMEMYLSRG